MQKIPSIIIFIILTFSSAFLSFAQENEAETGTLWALENLLYEKINEARANPLAVAESLGMDPNQILADFPDSHDILTKGLPPLVFDENIHMAASAHIEDMFSKGYYAYNSEDGRTCEERMSENGYIPLTAGESLGMLSFSNFIDAETAVNFIFENILRDQLSPDSTEQQTILNPDFKDIGIAVKGGMLKLGDASHNVYVVTCNFGTTFDKTTLEIFQLINQARTRPLDAAVSLGFDVDRILAEKPSLYNILMEGLPPLTLNPHLYQSAMGHASDMLENGYYDSVSADGRTYEARMLENGYDYLTARESMAVSFCESTDAVQLFESIFEDELFKGIPMEKRNILNPSMKEVGIGFAEGISSGSLKGFCSDSVQLMVLDFAYPASVQSNDIVGIVYTDQNEDNFYNTGEGIYTAHRHKLRFSEVGFSHFVACQNWKSGLENIRLISCVQILTF